jgi:cysteine desulfurase
MYCRGSVRWTPLLYGGSQERKLRAGTENVAGIVGFAEALQLVKRESDVKRNKLWELRRLFLGKLQDELSTVGLTYCVNGHPTEVLPNIMNISFPGLATDTLLMNLDLAGIAASSGSACSAGSLEPSHVLQAMGLSDERLRSAVRFSLGYGLTEEDVLEAAGRVAEVVIRMRERISRVR